MLFTFLIYICVIVGCAAIFVFAIGFVCWCVKEVVRVWKGGDISCDLSDEIKRALR